MNTDTPLSRRDFVKSAGGLLIGFSISGGLVEIVHGQAAQPPAAGGPVPVGPPLGRIGSWMRIAPDGLVTVCTGKVEVGMGVNVALAQIVAEELSVPVSRVTMIMGDTSGTPDQGGVGSSNSVASGGAALRNVAATVRGLLLQAAAKRLDAPLEQLAVQDGVVTSKVAPGRSLPYGDLVKDVDFGEALRVSGSGFTLNVQGSGTPRRPADYSVVGTAVRRTDIAEKIFGTFKYVVDVRVPGMLHGRVSRPPAAGAQVLGVDDTAAKAVAGFVQTVVRGNFVGVVATSEWGAVKAARALKVTWSDPGDVFPEQSDLYTYMRTAPPKATRESLKRGDARGAIDRAARRVEAVYAYPFHSHATMGPGCAVADVQPDGITTVWCGAQKPHQAQRGYAELIGVAPDNVRVAWVADAGSYGRPGFDDVGADALILSQATGKPVRVQWMRADLTGWGPKGPAAVFELRAGLDAEGHVSGVQFTSKAFSGGEINFIPTAKGNFLAAQLMGLPNTSGFDEFAEWGAAGGGAAPYAFPDLLSTAHIVPSLHATPSPLAGTHLRDPNGPSTSFAVESFIDELAAAAGVDPIGFRTRYLTDDRAKAVLAGAAAKFGWQPRPAPASSRDDTVRGRGVALGIRGGTYVGNIAEVEVNRRTGVVRVVRYVMAHDCGLVVNPLGLTQTLQANIVQTLSRTMKEEVRFDRRKVTSVDWTTYPITRMSDVPAQIDIVIINRPEVAATGAGEAGTRAVAAAVANAIFDATGVRVRQVPFTVDRVKTALALA
ncbi:MAG TPA: molybdopterin cofactor-binding domain-containing protein [Vicinamibacterales bacterium]|nr:molybdopterin cofactor-binding domain-containing protein [Vicinamibacterales bacterium]